jgi:hypothetical protein
MSLRVFHHSHLSQFAISATRQQSPVRERQGSMADAFWQAAFGRRRQKPVGLAK